MWRDAVTVFKALFHFYSGFIRLSPNALISS